MTRTGHLLSTTAATFGLLLAQSAVVAAQDQDEEIEEVVVTGSYIARPSQADSPSPLSVLSTADIDSLGAKTVADVIQKMTINTGSQNNPDAFTQNFSSGTENFNLRGLGVSSTLVLLNGKRQVFSGAPTDQGLLFVDTASLIPLIAVERIETLKDGASALYGSDAVAGVVNFITRDDFEGFEVSADIQSVTKDSQEDIRVQAITGFGNDRTHFTAAFSYFDRSPLKTSERRLPGSFDPVTGDFSNAGQPGSIIAPFRPLDPTLGAIYDSAFDNVTALFVFPDNSLATIPLPDGSNLPFPLPGSMFAGFAPAGTRDTIADSLTSVVLSGIGAAFNIPIDANALGALNTAIGQAGFLTPAYADPACGTSPVSVPPPAVTDGSGNVLIPAGIVGLCRLDFGDFFNLVAEESRIQGFAKFTHEFSREFEFYSEFSYARNRASRGNTPSFPPPQPLSLAGNNPFLGPFRNALLQSVLWVGRAIGEGEPFNSTHHSETYRIQGGFRGELPSGWNYDLSYTHAANDYQFTAGDQIKSRFLNALAGLGGPNCDPDTGTPGVGGCQYFNPFGSANLPGAESMMVPLISPLGVPTGNFVPVANSQEVIDWMTTRFKANVDTDLDLVDGVVSGGLMELWGGTLSGAFGAQYRREKLNQDWDDFYNAEDLIFVIGGPDFGDNRDIFAIFGELAVPLGADLSLQVATRYENYGGGIGDTIDPKVALLYRPNDEFAMRASFSTAFRAPSVFQVFGTQTNLQQLLDPLGSGTPQFHGVRTVGSSSLKPEQSKAWNVGFTWNAAANIELNVDYWRFDFTDVITQESAQAILDANPLDPRVIRDPATGAIGLVNTSYVNAASLKTDGLDVSAAYTWETNGAGNFRASFETTYIMNYDLVDPQAGKIEGAGNRNFRNFGTSAPEWRFNAGLSWIIDRHNVNVFVRRIGGYHDDQNDVPIDSHTTVDLQYNVQLPSYFGLNEGAYLSIGAINVFDNAPPLVRTNGGFDSKVHDPRGRLVYARVTQRF